MARTQTVIPQVGMKVKVMRNTSMHFQPLGAIVTIVGLQLSHQWVTIQDSRNKVIDVTFSAKVSDLSFRKYKPRGKRKLEGVLKGEVCNRNGCCGVIDEHDSDSGCTCFINPPCSHCTDSRCYCPECGYDGREEQIKADIERTRIYNQQKQDNEKKMHV